MVSCHYLNDDNSDGGEVDLLLPQLLLGNCQLFIYDCIPPRGLLNEFLLGGEGHTLEHRRVRWLPFALDEAAYAALVGQLEGQSFAPESGPLRVRIPPEGVEDRRAWHAWLMAQELGIPYTENLRRMRREDEAAQRCHQAGVAGDTAGRKYWEGEWMHRVLERVRFQQPYFPDVPGEGEDEA